MALFRTAPAGGAFHRRFTDYSGLFFDEFASDSAWIREEGRVRLPPLDGIDALVVSGTTCRTRRPAAWSRDRRA